MKSLFGRAKAAFAARREAWPWFDHLIRAAQRYKLDHGDRLAAALTMYAILALLPLLLVAMSVLGYVLANDPDAQAKVFAKITSVVPGVGNQLSEALGTVKESRGTIGLIGVAGLLLSGLGGVDALRDSLRLMWHQNVDAGNLLKKKGVDVVTVFVLAGTLAVSFGISALATGGAGVLLDRAGVGGAVFGGVCFGVLKVAGAWYVGRTATKSTALYGSIGTAVAVLVGLYLVSRVILFTAAWTVTAPGWDDLEPSGTASPEAARAAGVPVEAVTDGRTHEPHRLDRVGAALATERATEAAEDAPEPEAASEPPASVALPVPARESRMVAAPAREPAGRLAGRAVQGFVATMLAVAGVRGLRALRRG